MRKVIALLHLSLDGFAADVHNSMGWIQHDDEVFSYVDTFIERADCGLYGRYTYGMMEAHWPSALKDPSCTGHQLKHARWYAAANKVVFTRGGAALQSGDARLAAGDLVEEVGALKNSEGKDLMIFGSPNLVRSFFAHGLLDELVINVNPIALGSGVSPFSGIGKAARLSLVASTRFQCGVIGCHYRVL